MTKRRPYVGVRYCKARFNQYSSTQVATIFVGNREPGTPPAKLYVLWFPAREGISVIRAGYYVLPHCYSVPHDRFSECFLDLNEAVEHGRIALKEQLAANASMKALGVA